MNGAASAEENFLASSTASSTTTLKGVPIVRNSHMARRRMARSMAEIRSIRQFRACAAMRGSSSSGGKRSRVFEKLIGKIAGRFLCVRALPESALDTCRVLLAHFPLKQHLQSVLARFPAKGHLAGFLSAECCLFSVRAAPARIFRARLAISTAAHHSWLPALCFRF